MSNEEIKSNLISRFKELSSTHLTLKPGRAHDRWLCRADEVELILLKFFEVSQDELDAIYVLAETESKKTKAHQD